MTVKEFKLGWRFTDEKYALFSDDELSKIEIIPPHIAASIWNRICDDEILSKSSYVTHIVSREMPVLIADCGWGDEIAEQQTAAVLTKFFAEHGAVDITILYDSKNAINVPAELFCEKWSDFCYPSDTLCIKYGLNTLLYYEDIIYMPTSDT